LKGCKLSFASTEKTEKPTLSDSDNGVFVEHLSLLKITQVIFFYHYHDKTEEPIISDSKNGLCWAFTLFLNAIISSQ
jgi:hypothetical protein